MKSGSSGDEERKEQVSEDGEGQIGNLSDFEEELPPSSDREILGGAQDQPLGQTAEEVKI